MQRLKKVALALALVASAWSFADIRQAGTAQARADDANEIARAHTPLRESFGQRDQVAFAERSLQFGQCAEGEHQRALAPADLGFDLATMRIGHGASPD